MMNYVCRHVPYTWTLLDQTAEQGTNILHLKDSVTWKVDDEIVIATTGIDISFLVIFSVLQTKDCQLPDHAPVQVHEILQSFYLMS